jgi:hypothetical protein
LFTDSLFLSYFVTPKQVNERNEMKNTTFTASVVSDLFNAGYSCDGHPFIAEQFYVVIENAAGKRFRHQAIFNGTQQVICEETGDAHFPDLRAEASAKADRLAARVNAALDAGQFISPTFWDEIDPAYGSDAYVDQGTEAKRLFAEKAAA